MSSPCSKPMRDQVRDALVADGVPADEIELRFEADLRYAGQAFEVPMPSHLDDFDRPGGLAASGRELPRGAPPPLHLQHGHRDELVNLRAIALGRAHRTAGAAPSCREGDGDPIAAKLRDHQMWVDGAFRPAVIYERAEACAPATASPARPWSARWTRPP